MPGGVRVLAAAGLIGLLPVMVMVGHTQDRAATSTLATRVSERIKTLQSEADQLARQAQTLLGDLRQLEIQRDIAIERAGDADTAANAAQASLQQTAARLSVLEQQRVEQLPDLAVRLVDIYKRGQGGYARMLLDARGVREFARSMRAIAALTAVNGQRIDAYRQTLAEVREQRAANQQYARELQVAAGEAARARTAAQRAVEARGALVAQIDTQRDLNAQLSGELRLAYDRLQQELASLAAGRQAEPVTVPLRSFRGALDWPADGRVDSAANGRPDNPRTDLVRNGIEIASVAGSPVQAVHPGTVDFADPFTGFGNLVIVDHGGGYFSLYGYLAAIEVARGARVEAGTPIGRVGTSPAGAAALYFELRVDGRSVDPLQWLKAR